MRAEVAVVSDRRKNGRQHYDQHRDQQNPAQPGRFHCAVVARLAFSPELTRLVHAGISLKFMLNPVYIENGKEARQIYPVRYFTSTVPDRCRMYPAAIGQGNLINRRGPPFSSTAGAPFKSASAKMLPASSTELMTASTRPSGRSNKSRDGDLTSKTKLDDKSSTRPLSTPADGPLRKIRMSGFAFGAIPGTPPKVCTTVVPKGAVVDVSPPR